jgi:alpha-beta hydrolase superfamily lysophospholipase
MKTESHHASITNSKGLTLASIIHRPSERGLYPTVILLHGFTGYKEERHEVVLAEELAAQGFVAVRFDFSGYGESGGTVKDDYRFSHHYEDVRSVCDYVTGLDYVDSHRVGLWGHSLGGSMAVVFAADHPDLIKSVSIVGSPTMLQHAPWIEAILASWKASGFFYFKNGDYPGANLPYEYIADIDKFNILESARKLQQPLQVVLGYQDEAVDPRNTKEIYESAGSSEKELVQIKDMKHNYDTDPEMVKKVNEAVLAFLSVYLRGSSDENTV